MFREVPFDVLALLVDRMQPRPLFLLGSHFRLAPAVAESLTSEVVAAYASATGCALSQQSLDAQLVVIDDTSMWSDGAIDLKRAVNVPIPRWHRRDGMPRRLLVRGSPGPQREHPILQRHRGRGGKRAAHELGSPFRPARCDIALWRRILLSHARLPLPRHRRCVRVLAYGRRAAGIAADRSSRGHEIFKELVETDTTQSAGDTAKAAHLAAAWLIAAGFPASDVAVFEPTPKRGNLVARLRGTGKRSRSCWSRTSTSSKRTARTGRPIRSSSSRRMASVRPRDRRRQVHGRGVAREHDPVEAARAFARPATSCWCSRPTKSKARRRRSA